MKNNEGWVEGKGRVRTSQEAIFRENPACVPLMHVFPNKSKQMRKEQRGVKTGWANTEGGGPCMDGDSNFKGLALRATHVLYTCVSDSLRVEDLLLGCSCG